MYRKLTYVISFVVALSLVGGASAADFRWDNSSGDSLWRNPENWDLNKLPDGGETAGDAVYINWLSDPTEIIVDADTEARCESVTVSNDAVGGQKYVHLHVTGGSLLAGNLIRIGRKELGMFTLDAGTVNCYSFQLGRKDPSKGVAYINGGMITVATNTRVPRGGSQGSELHLNGGILDTNGLVMNDPDDPLSGTNGSMDITGGVMILADDCREKLQHYIDQGWLTAYGAKSGELTADGRVALVRMDYNVTNPDKTTVWATAGRPTAARDPVPENGATITLAEATGVSWLPAPSAVEHDVYVGADFASVNDADTSDTTGIYQGRQAAAGYTFPEALEWGATYYWRIDEIEAGDTVHKGPVWSFTVADYLIVDDFESYNGLDPSDPNSNRIFNTWMDGFDQSANGSVVGYDSPPFVELSIVRSGNQSMPLFYDNSGTAIYSQAQRTFSPVQDWTREGVGVLSLWFRGNPAYVGSFVEAPAGTYTVTASGTDIWDTADEFHFAYKEVTGAAAIIAKVESVENTDPFAKAGVMIRNTLDADSANIAVLITPENGVRFQYRSTAGGITDRSFTEGVTAPQWVRLERTAGGLVRPFYSADGTAWTQLGIKSVTMNMPVYVGLAVTSHNAEVTCEAKFSNISFPDTDVGPQWIDQDIGMLGNEAEPMYVTVGDGSGTAATVYHDDPNAAVIDTWRQWNIDLTDFSDQGVILTNIESITIGLGDSNNPQAGGSGTMYFDDIRLYRPR